MNKFMFIVFYGQQIYGEYDSATMYALGPDLPDGCYMRRPQTNNWYLRLSGSWTPINLCDVPPEVRLNCLLMGIPV